MKMILEKNEMLYKNLKGFINKKNLDKLINKNKPFMINPNKVLLFIILFCGSIFCYHLYTILNKDKNEKEEIRIVPLAGNY